MAFTLGINAIGTRHSGAATVLIDLVHGLLEADRSVRLVVFASPPGEREFDLPQSERLTIVGAPWRTANPLYRFAWLSRRFSAAVQEHGCEAVVNLNNMAGKVPVPQVLFIQQSLYFSAEALRTYRGRGLLAVRLLGEAPAWRHVMRVSARRCARVVVQTRTMRSWVASRLSVDERRVSVLAPSAPALPPFSRPNPLLAGMRDRRLLHFLYVGNGNPYKNLQVVRDAADLARARGRKWRFHLTVPQPIEAGSSVIHSLGQLDRASLAEAYHLADAVIMPSLVETVGLPMLEAMAARTPVIAADRPYAHDICAAAALFFDPLSGESLFRSLEAVEEEQTRGRLALESARRLEEFPDRQSSARDWLRTVQGLAR